MSTNKNFTTEFYNSDLSEDITSIREEDYITMADSRCAGWDHHEYGSRVSHSLSPSGLQALYAVQHRIAMAAAKHRSG